MYYYEYHAVVYEDDEGEVLYQGVVNAPDYATAMDSIAQYFGDSSIMSISLECWTEDFVLTMSAEALKELKEKNCI